jgi:hypothetical protein
MRWVGIDEAGYGPNLGPLVMTAVIAESRDSTHVPKQGRNGVALDLWRDLGGKVDRAGGDAKRIWVDDSKAILRGGKGRDRLERTCMVVLEAAGHGFPRDFNALLAALGAGTVEDVELERWLDPGAPSPSCPAAGWTPEQRSLVAGKPLEPDDGSWRISGVRSVVVGPEQFNRMLSRLGSKALVHFAMFHQLLRDAWAMAADGRPTAVHSDKHGGRHYYLQPLVEAFPDAWIERGTEGPELSRYAFSRPGRAMGLSLRPRADSSDGLVALASIVSKTVRELWMDAFNAYWLSRVDGLRPTAGYPVDAARFRQDIESAAIACGLVPDLWWRRK